MRVRDIIVTDGLAVEDRRPHSGIRSTRLVCAEQTTVALTTRRMDRILHAWCLTLGQIELGHTKLLFCNEGSR